MKKAFVLAMVVGLAASVAQANYVVNGDFEAGSLAGWNQWGPIGWGAGSTIANAGSARTGGFGARIRVEPQGSLGIKQVVAVPANTPLDFTAYVQTGANSAHWAEVLLYPFAVTDDAAQIDSGAGSGPYLVWKRDSWGGVAGVPGGNLPTLDWEQVTGNISSPSGFVTIAFKFGASGTTSNTNLRVDDVSLVPEPACLILMLSGFGLILRRRTR